MHALVIEDEPLVSMLIQEDLAEMGYSSVVAATEEAAVAAAREQCPDLITVDAVLMEGSGVDAVRRICADGLIPTVYILGWFNDGEGVMPHASVMRKPFVTSTLYAAVGQAIVQVGRAATPDRTLRTPPMRN